MTSIVFFLFALLHSLTVSRRFKALVARAVGETYMRAFYRLGFTLFSAAITAAAAYLIWVQPDVVYYTPPWYARIPARTVQLAGVLIMLAAFRPFDTASFLGVRQAAKYIKTGRTGGDIEGIEEAGLITTGIYGRVRHPMYLGGILIFMFEPVISDKTLTLRLLATAYFVFGALMEERRFGVDFGEGYEAYRRTVPMFNVLRK